jgi:hypothetical protein
MILIEIGQFVKEENGSVNGLRYGDGDNTWRRRNTAKIIIADAIEGKSGNGRTKDNAVNEA